MRSDFPKDLPTTPNAFHVPALDQGPSSERAIVEDPLVGAVLLERVRIERPIARGGMGMVYLGQQTRLGRRCAVKVLDPRLTRGGDAREFSRRFLLEASVAARIAHPNVVTIFDYGDTPEGCFIAMEYLDGRSLADELKKSGRLPFERAIHIARQIGRALREAHVLGVVHRDIKPGNVFLVRQDDDEDCVKVLDFGLVHDRQEVRDQPVADAIMGSPRFMAPEQVQGKEVDPRTDIYSLGVVLYAMLTGHPPFERRTELATMMAQVSDPPPAIETVAPGLVLPHGLEAVVMRCLAKNPDDRWSSMEELVAALQLRSGAAFGEPTPPAIVAPSLSSLPRLDGPAAQPRGRGRFAAAIAVAALGAAICGTILVRAPSRSNAPAAPAAAAPAPPPAIAPPAVAAVAPPAPAAPAIPPVKVHLESEPPGAKVNEEGETLCAATPCDVTYTGDAAKPDAEHLVAFLLPGYKLERKIVKAGSAGLRVKLVRAR